MATYYCTQHLRIPRFEKILAQNMKTNCASPLGNCSTPHEKNTDEDSGPQIHLR